MSAQCSTMSAAIACAGSSVFLRSKFENTAAMPSGTTAATIDPIKSSTSRKFSAIRSAISGQFASVLSRARRRTSVVLRKRLSIIRHAGQLDLFGHLVQPAAQSRADAIVEIIDVVGREDRRPLRVIPAVDDVVEDVLHEQRRVLLALTL